MSLEPRNSDSSALHKEGGPRDRDLGPAGTESLRQALEALRSAVHLAADTDLELLIRGELPPSKATEEPAAGNAGAATRCEPLAEATLQFQTDYIRRVISQCDGNMSLAAEKLGLHRANLYRKMRQLGMAEERTGHKNG